MPVRPKSAPMAVSDLLRRGAADLGVTLEESQLARMERYFSELLKWNRRINLVGPASDEQLIELHFLDSLTLIPFIDPCPEPGLVDVGSGAGFPGLVLKIARPDILVTLVEPRQKRAAFLRQVIRSLGLEGVEVREARLEKNHAAFAAWRNAIPLFTSRAFTDIAGFLDLCESYCAPGGRVICMKGRKATEEVGDWREKHPGSSFRLELEVSTNLPYSGIPRKLLVFDKRQSRGMKEGATRQQSSL